ncbi:MAG: beta-ketoacyl synthase chain length factor [Thermodesulfobacteriota bacterium]
MKLAIRGIGVVGGFGNGIGDLEQALINPSLPHETPLPCDLPCPHKYKIFSAKTERLKEFIPKKALRRMDHFSRMAVLAACFALLDAGAPFSLGYRTGVIVASGYGSARATFAFLDSVMEHGDRCGSPIHFSNSVHNSAAAHLSIALEGFGPNSTISLLDMSIPAAFLLAEVWLSEGRVESVLIGGVDEHCPVLEYCWSRLFD